MCLSLCSSTLKYVSSTLRSVSNTLTYLCHCVRHAHMCFQRAQVCAEHAQVCRSACGAHLGAGSYLKLIDSCITQLKAHGLSRTCKESKDEEEGAAVPRRARI